MIKTLLQPDMQNYFLSAISCLFLLQTGLLAEECSQAVLAKRNTFNAPAGGSLSLSCDVQHCGDTWTGHWMWKNSTNKNLRAIEESVRLRFTSVMLSTNVTKQILNFLSVNQLDKGFYGCKVTWSGGDTDQGHLMYVNITAAVPSQRSVLHRVLVCSSACLCLPIILGLARCLSPVPRTLSTHAAVYTRDQPHLSPQPPPRRPVPQKRSTAYRKVPTNSQQSSSHEVVYADISQDALNQQRATREPDQSTVYSAVRFS